MNERHGVRFGNGDPMRRAAEKDYFSGLTQIGIRYVSSTARDGYVAAREMGRISCRSGRRALGTKALLDRIRAGAHYYLTIDVDAFDPPIASGKGTPSHGGFLYYEVLELIAGLVKRGTVVGVDLGGCAGS